MNVEIAINPKSVPYEKVWISHTQILNGTAVVYAALVNAEYNNQIQFSIELTQEEYDGWGTDDNYIYDLVLSKLGVVKA